MRTAKGSNATNHIAYQRIGDACGEELPVEDDGGQLYQSAIIDVLPDDVLIEVFDFYLRGDLDAWRGLVHVCQRWRRQVVFASPRRLNLRLLCTNKSPVKKLLDIWPALPIVIESRGTALGLRRIANIDAALERNDRVCKITSSISDPLFNTFASIKEPFPALTSLKLSTLDYWLPTLPDSFLGGSAPRLRTFKLYGIPFPGLPKLLLSAHQLVHLTLLKVPDSGYISPEAMVTCLSSLTSLESLVLDFRPPGSRPDQTNRHLPPLTLTALPSLTSLSFKGDSEYLEDVVARIDVPLLNEIRITFLNRLIFDTPLLRSFISRTETFKAFRAMLSFYSERVNVILLPGGRAYKGRLHFGLSFKPSDEQPSSVARACNFTLPRLPTLEYLSISESRSYGSHWQDDIEVTQWLELFRPFITAKCLYLDENLAQRVAPALQELAEERVTEVLPALQNVFVQGPVPRAIARFIAARQHLGHPVAVQDWDGK